MLLVRYKYDGMSRLIREDNRNAHKTVVYTYDSNGNMTSKTEYALSFTDELGTAVDTVTSTYGNGVWQGAITSYDGEWVFHYDMGGNPLSYRGYAMTWAKGRQLSALSGNGITASFKYNNSGIRTSKTVNGVKTVFTYVGDMLISQKTGNETINFFYTAGGAPLGFTYNGTPYFYLLNLQGDIISIYDSTGEIVVDYIYDTWGKLISVTGSLADTIGVKNPLRYRGYYYDTETSLYYLQSRYYDPETCRFINADAYVVAGSDYIQGTNMYAYCYNNPVMYVDPSGQKYDPIFDTYSTQLEAALHAVGVLLSICAYVQSIYDYGMSIGYTENEIASSLEDFTERVAPLCKNLFYYRDILKIGVSIMVGDTWWTNILSNTSFMEDLVKLMKMDFLLISVLKVLLHLPPVFL